MYAFALLTTLVPAAPPANDAERLLAEMDARIVAAKSIRIEFTIDDSNPDTKQRLATGKLLIASGNRFRYELDGNVVAHVVSDGKHLVSVFAKPVEKKSQLTPAWLNEVQKSWLGRGGTFISTGRILEFANASVGEEPAEKAGPKATNAKLLSSEEIDGIKANVVEYDLAFPKMLGDMDGAKVRVWINPKTMLPIRRTMTFKFGSEDKIYTAIHTKFEVNSSLDDKLFELPK